MSSSTLRNFLYLDTETTVLNKGHPFSASNKLCAVGILFQDKYYEWDIEHGTAPYGPKLDEIRHLISQASRLVGFNIKFDLHWLRAYMPDLKLPPVWDVQLFEFIKTSQNAAFQSLDEVAIEYKLPPKLDVLKTEYWDKGLDTTDAPWEIVSEYLKRDVHLTYEITQYQLAEDRVSMPLFYLHCHDLLVLEEMEYNGLLYDRAMSDAEAERIVPEIEATEEALAKLCPVPINWNSSDQVSAFLYGGLINYESTETVTRQYKHTSRTYERKCIKQHVLPRQVQPLPRGETAQTANMGDEELKMINLQRKEANKPPFFRIYSVDEPTLQVLRRHRSVRKPIDLLLKLANLRKLQGTYYKGIPKLMDTMQWENDFLHGQINQCRAITGRTSSSKPNLQNFDKRLKLLFPSRFRSPVHHVQAVRRERVESGNVAMH